MKSPKLVVISGPLPGQEYPLLGEVVSIGRDWDNAIPFPSEFRVSAHHARILARIGLFWLEDLHSTNGTFLSSPEGKRFRLTPGDPILLVDDALIHLADVVTLQARGLITSQDEAARQALAQVQAFVSAFYDQALCLTAQEREDIEGRLRKWEKVIRQAASESELVRLVAEGLTNLSHTIGGVSPVDLPPIPEALPDPDSPYRLPSLNNLFISRLQQIFDRKEKKK